MIAYNNEWLKNLLVRDEATESHKDKHISKAELELIETKYPVQFYSPNFFIRIGLFILTIIILFFSFGLITLIFLGIIDKAISGLAIFFGMLAYAGLEYMVQTKNHYRSGVDDALLWIAALSIFGGISYMVDATPMVNCVFGCLISFYCVIRFTNSLMVVVTYLSLLGIFFFAATQSGVYGKAFAPFILMAVSAIIYLVAAKLRQAGQLPLYNHTLQITRICSLPGFYVAGNYFVVRELSNEMFDLHLTDNQGIPYGWIFWIFTFSIPALYLARGIQKKDPLMIRMGLLLVAAIVFTVKCYSSIPSIETTMTIAGIIMLGIAYALSVWLKKPKFGFTAQDLRSEEAQDKLEIESLVVAQTFSAEEAVADVTTFGGGSFGGGGSSGQF